MFRQVRVTSSRQRKEGDGQARLEWRGVEPCLTVMREKWRQELGTVSISGTVPLPAGGNRLEG